MHGVSCYFLALYEPLVAVLLLANVSLPVGGNDAHRQLAS